MFISSFIMVLAVFGSEITNHPRIDRLKLLAVAIEQMPSEKYEQWRENSSELTDPNWVGDAISYAVRSDPAFSRNGLDYRWHTRGRIDPDEDEPRPALTLHYAGAWGHRDAIKSFLCINENQYIDIFRVPDPDPSPAKEAKRIRNLIVWWEEYDWLSTSRFGSRGNP